MMFKFFDDRLPSACLLMKNYGVQFKRTQKVSQRYSCYVVMAMDYEYVLLVGTDVVPLLGKLVMASLQIKNSLNDRL
jgi:hypothetical protein